jgi:glycine betaine/choline ABC-type transport system substrate-binding protein
MENGKTVSHQLPSTSRIRFGFSRGAILLVAFAAMLSAGCRAKRSDTIVVGSKNFTEQIVLAELFAQQIEARCSVTRRSLRGKSISIPNIRVRLSLQS